MGIQFVTPPALGRTKSPMDVILEVMPPTAYGGGGKTFTMLTDTVMIGQAIFAIPVSAEAAQSTEAVSVVTLADTVVCKGESGKTHTTYIFGGHGGVRPRFFRFRSAVEPAPPGSLYWEIISKTTNAGMATITYADDFAFPLTKAEIIIPVDLNTGASADNDFRSCGVIDVGATTAKIVSKADHDFRILVGGYISGTSSVESANAYHLKGGQVPKPGELWGEIILKTLGGSSPSTVTITAADDCEIIRQVEFVIPMSQEAAPISVGWGGDRGKTATLYGDNGNSDVIRCMVLGYI